MFEDETISKHPRSVSPQTEIGLINSQFWSVKTQTWVIEVCKSEMWNVKF